MIRTVLRRTSLVRLRPGLIAGRAAPCCSAVTWPAAVKYDAVPPSHFPRYFSVATTDETTLEAEPDVIDVKVPKTKKKKTRKKRDRPTKKNARKLFDEIAPHMPLKTLSDITRKLKRSAPKVRNDEEITTQVGKVHALLEKANIPPWAQQRFQEFLFQKPFRGLKDHDSFPLTLNKASLESHTELLMKARDLSAQRPLLWSVAQRRKISVKKKGAATDDDVGSDATEKQDTPPDPLIIHQSKSEETRQKESEELVVLLAERLPEKAYKDLMEMFTMYVEQTTNPKKPKVRMLWRKLSTCVSTHIHFVAEQVATFFYVQNFTPSDPRLRQREKNWEAEEAKFVESVLQINDALENPVPSQSRGLTEENADTLGELEKLRTRPSDGVKVGRDRQKEQARHGRRKKNVHLVFDAMLLQDEWTAPQPQQYIVFVDNLPIDMEETDLLDLFSRCGPIKSVQIFNQRETLDPGPLSAKNRREQKVKQRQSQSRIRSRWKRPRTPVYCQITFTSQEGYDNAVDAPLRIFGMVVRKHPMRTIRTIDMTSLYLEDIPEGMYSLDIEHKLSQLLHPEIYVCLDVGQHDFAEPSSCEIKFPSFEMAQYAFHKLQELDIEGVSLQWMRTPEDAMKYWTREYSFET